MLLFLSLITVCVCSQWAVELEPSVDPQTFALEHRLKYVERIDVFDIFEANEETSNMNFHLTDAVVSAERQVAKKHYTRSINPQDPLYPSQWHLKTVNATAAWSAGLYGNGIVVAIVDDGLQHTHPDLHANYDATNSWDFNGNDADPMPNSRDGHGTSAAGVAGAVQGNNFGGTGVAPKIKLAGIRLIASSVYDYIEARALSYHRDSVKVYSCSWGPYDGGTDLVGPGAITKKILKSGSIYVWAGGNGRAHKDNVNYDGYANSIYTIAIGAIDSNGNQAYYSESGASLFAVTPSSGSGRGITTTDLMGPEGYSNGNYTHSFGGTSSATPLAAGIIAILLQKHPHLDSRGIQHLIAAGATKIHETDSDWSHINARGYSHSHKYGFGLMEISQLLQTPVYPLKPMVDSTTGFKRMRVTLPCEQTFHVPRKINFIEYVEVTVSFYAQKRGDISIVLIKDGVQSILASKRDDRHRGMTTWTYTTARHWGDTTTPQNKWKVKLNNKRGDGSQLRGVEIKVFGS